MTYPKIYIGPMTKNVVDSIIEFTNEYNIPVGLIPSRRQIEYDKGYVNNWSTHEFTKYVKNSKIIIERDHAGPGQGKTYDDGYESLRNDCIENFDIIHIDPWKEHQGYVEGLEETINMIKFCNSINPNVKYEVGTEESIRPFTPEQLEDFLVDLSYGLGQELFEKIIYVVIQSGTSLKGTSQTGVFDKDKLKTMLYICKKYKKLSKEHNGDYLSIELIKEKFDLGLDAINIAPEFGVIETNAYLNAFNEINITGNEEIPFLEEFYKLCYDSKKWVKWVDKNFDPKKQYMELVMISGHYVLSHPDFISNIKNKIPFDIDSIIKREVILKLKELHGIKQRSTP